MKKRNQKVKNVRKKASNHSKAPSKPPASYKGDLLPISNRFKESPPAQVVRRSTRQIENRKRIKNPDLFKNQILDLPKLLKKISSHNFSLTQENPSQKQNVQSQKESCKEKRSMLKRKHEEISQLQDTEMDEIIQILKKLKIEDPSENIRLKKAEGTKKKVEAVLGNYEFLRNTPSLETLRKELGVMLGKIGHSLVGATLPEKVKLNLLYCLDVSFEEEELDLLSMKTNNMNKYSKMFSSLNLLALTVVDRIKECIEDCDEVSTNYPWD